MDEDWLSEPISTSVAPQRRTAVIRAALVAAGAVIGGVVVTSLHHDSTASAGSPTAFAGPQGGGQLPGGGLPGGGLQGGPPGGFAGPGGGGPDGEQRLSGTLVSVGASSVTVKTSSGTATYDVTSSSQIVRNGQVVAVSALKAGDPVFVHVYPSGSGTTLTVERLFAGSLSSAGPPNSRV